MIVHFTAEDIERADRIMRDPFDSDEVRLFIYGEPVASDDGLFKPILDTLRAEKSHTS